MQISHNSIDKYVTCPMLWKNHYIDRIRSTTISSALFFGGYIGDTWQMMALDKKPELNAVEKNLLGKDPFKHFDSLMDYISINGTKFPAKTCPNIRYYRKDYDSELMLPEYLIECEAYGRKKGITLNGTLIPVTEFMDEYLTDQIFDDEVLTYINMHLWFSLREKGRMMIRDYKNEILPNIIKIYALEKPIKIDMSLPDNPKYTDFIIGYIDMICDYQINDPKLATKLDVEIGTILKVLFDHKTSSGRYGTKKLSESEQLNLYDYVEQNKQIGYIVAVKTIKRPKRNPRKGEIFVDLQVMVGKSDSELQEKILDNAELVIDGINANQFPKNTEKCKMQYGVPCIYNNYCKTGDMRGLTQKGVRK